MHQRRFIFDPSLCISCRSCELACRNEFFASGGERWRWLQPVQDREWGTYVLSLSCNHCENPECFRVCPERTYRKRKDGIVLHDPRRCTGCGDCVRACPYGAPQYSFRTGKVDKCNFCVHRIDKHTVTACVEACPTEALRQLSNRQEDPIGVLYEIPGFEKILLTRPSTRFIINQEMH